MASRKDELLEYLSDVQRRLIRLYGSTYKAVIEIAEVKKAIEAGADFTWKGNPQAEKKFDRLLSDLAEKAGTLVVDGVERSYSLGEREASDPLLSKFGTTEETKKGIEEICEEAARVRREAGRTAHAYATAATNGLTISQRVWDLNSNAKRDLEVIIQNGIMEGKGAAKIATGMKGCLNNPQTLFRRVKDKETGQYRLSKAAQAYHPGQGVYRSAYKNALRLARTEMTAAYRLAEWESYQDNDLVTGIEIKLSGNHTTLTTEGKPERIRDICDELAGVYPKTFKWTGWHPQCRCYMVPVTVSTDDFADYLKARRAKRADKWKPADPDSPQIDELPVNFTQWAKANASALAKAKTLPAFVADNQAAVGNIIARPFSALQIASQRHANRTPAQEQEIRERWEERAKRLPVAGGDPKITEIVSDVENNIRTNKSFETAAAFDKDGNVIIDKRGQSYSVSFTADELKNMKDCIMTHNHPRGWGYAEDDPRHAGNSFGKSDITLAVAHNLSEIRAVTPSHTYSLIRPESGWGTGRDHVKKAFEEIENKVRVRNHDLMKNGMITKEQAEATHFHKVCSLLAKRFGWDYRRKKTI